MIETNSSRRSVRRPALASGCSMWTPISMSVTNTVQQGSVQYQATPSGVRSCGACLNFIPGSNTCKVVEGRISPQGWCNVWVARA